MGRLGIIAGGGSLPVRLAEVCGRAQKDFFILALQGHADEYLLNNFSHAVVRLGETGKAIALLHAAGVDKVVMAGAIGRPWLWGLRPDFRTIRVLVKLGLRMFGDDTMLRAVARELEKEGLQVIGAHDIDPSLLTPEGVLGNVQPAPGDQDDIALGIKVSKQLGKADAGQAAVVRQGVVLGVENAKGTDSLLRRCKAGQGGVLVKSCKPQQDRRLDLPTIGRHTIEQAQAAGLAGIAAESGASLILERDEVVAAADKAGIFLVGFRAP